MKKIIFAITALSFLFMAGCVNDSDDFNDNRDRPYDVPPETLLAYAQKSLADQMTTPSVNLNVFRFFQKYWATTDYPGDARFNFTGTRRVPDNHWLNLYTNVLGNLETAKQNVGLETKPSTITEEQFNKQQANKIAIIDILQVYTYQILVDSFGDIPYSEALDPTNVLPAYDNDSEIYPMLIDRLNDDIAMLDVNYGSFTSGDNLLNGDVGKWNIFANSLKLKLGINLADTNSSLAKSTVESAYAAGVILSNSNNAIFKYPSAAPNYNQIYANVIASGRNDYVGEETLIDHLNMLEDPRISSYFTAVDGEYIGGVLGTLNTWTELSHVGDMLIAPDFHSFLFDASEVNFYLAEAAARGYSVGGSEENYYNAAITASMEQWGVPTVNISTYLTQPNVAYSTATGDWKEKIGTQAWIAMYNRGFESWNFFRRLDYPLLTAPNAVPAAQGKIPTRLTYPIPEQTVNGTNWTAASTAIGGDNLTTKVFWDVN
ncbi:SusD/RagB family nutrient-binding outer membrane lipoprotein [Moheibacter sediminis]|uniref:Susd and RagB outer membrane lipoprotein n=1 Tax=Moheibacter sediminis TaxID=1434700 RepID=A0A1W2C2K0_9FLAO|nr:SusD/RagB family nutrient-binding outer membrane lipoprotein [Moheibacter sediminis]SMC79409.1 Susd and RagB outer membrane lipoprotein [Moheibacter sediminis]